MSEQAVDRVAPSPNTQYHIRLAESKERAPNANAKPPDKNVKLDGPRQEEAHQKQCFFLGPLEVLHSWPTDDGGRLCEGKVDRTSLLPRTIFFARETTARLFWLSFGDEWPGGIKGRGFG